MHSGRDNKLERAELEMEATQNNISQIHDAIVIAQANSRPKI